MSAQSTAAIIGGGPAGLMAAERLAGAGVRVTVYDRMPSIGRKLLMAGRGGLNLTHSEPLPRFHERYCQSPPLLREAIEAFPPERLRAWCAELGQTTFVGSSGRVFPTAMKASPLLRAWLQRLARQGVRFALRHRWTGWDEAGHLRFETPDGALVVQADAVVLATGGASWPQLGSDGAWINPVQGAGLSVLPLRPANCGFAVAWSPMFRDRFEGAPLKNVSLKFRGESARGDVMVTRDGLEGGAIYALSASLREAILAEGQTRLEIVLRPDLSDAALADRLEAGKAKQSQATMLRKTLRLAPVSIALLHEDPAFRSGYRSGANLAGRINAVGVTLTGIAPIDRAISTAGGLAFAAIAEDFMVRGRPGLFAAGEMLDWEAPTGGYLLQACLATGSAAGQGAADWLGGSSSSK